MLLASKFADAFKLSSPPFETVKLSASVPLKEYVVAAGSSPVATTLPTTRLGEFSATERFMPLSSSSLSPHAVSANAFNGISAAIEDFGFLNFLSNLFRATSFEAFMFSSNGISSNFISLTIAVNG